MVRPPPDIRRELGSATSSTRTHQPTPVALVGAAMIQRASRPPSTSPGNQDEETAPSLCRQPGPRKQPIITDNRLARYAPVWNTNK
eukprot:scaffold7798_cov126-Isochrysis_galbana.AAC.7